VSWLVVVLCLSSALCSAISTTLKKAAATRGEPGRFAGLGRPLWLAGLAADVSAVALQIAALHYGALALVQPLLVTSLLFALILRHHGTRWIPAGEAIWGLLLVACLSGFLYFSGAIATADTATPPATRSPLKAGALELTEGTDRATAVVAALTIVVAVAACLRLAVRSTPRTGRATLLGVGVGVLYAMTAALIKTSTSTFSHHGAFAVISAWQTYALVGIAAGAQLLAQYAFRAGPITASLPATFTVDPLLSVVIGVLVYNEHLHRGPLGGIVLAVLLLILAISVLQLARSAIPDTPHEQPARATTATT